MKNITTNTATVPTDTMKEAVKGYVRKSNPADVEIAFAKLNAAVEEQNKVFGSDNLSEQRTAVDKTEKALAEYNNTKTLVEYENFMEQPIPMKAALIKGFISLKKVISKTELGITKFSVEDTDAQVDFVAFNGFTQSMSAKTQLIASQMGYMVLLKEGMADGQSAAAITAAYQKAKGRVISKVYTGKTAPSNNAMKEQLQELIDAIFFEDNGNGKNKFMVTNEWMHWFTSAINKATYGKGFLTRTGKNPKQIIQTAAALYNAFYNKYGISLTVDREAFCIAASPYDEEKKAAEGKTTKSKKVAVKA